MTEALEKLKRQGLERISFSTGPTWLPGEVPTDTAHIDFYPSTTKRKQATHLAKQIRILACRRCALNGNKPLDCTRVRDPGVFPTRDRPIETHSITINHPHAVIKARTKLPGVYWDALAGRIPCMPEGAKSELAPELVRNG